MGDDDRLDDVLDAWQSAFARGEDPPLADLCRDCPDLLPEVERRVAALRRVEGLRRPAGAAGSTRDPAGRSAASPDSTAPYERASGTAASGAVAAPGYEVGAEIARGSMGRVLAARDLVFGREVAIKVVLDRAAAGPGARARAEARFVREARITGRLAHPNIPPVYRLGRLADGSPFLAMKLVRGRTLAALLAERPDVGHDLPRYVAAVEQLCQAVGYAHAQGVVHRDLKPANVMVGAFGEVQVMDWGLAKVPAGRGDEPPETDPATDALGRTTAYTYTAEGHLRTVTDPLNQTTTLTWSSAGLLESVQDPLGRLVTSVYDAYRRLVGTLRGGAPTGTVLYDAAGHPAGVTDPLGNTATVVNDALGRPVLTVAPDGGATTQVYDAAGLLTGQIDPSGARTSSRLHKPAPGRDGRGDRANAPGVIPR